MLAHPAAVLSIDDLSASLDVQTEHELLTALRAQAADRVLVVVTNRPQTHRLADQVLRLP